MLRRYFSLPPKAPPHFAYIPAAPTWDPQALLPSAASPCAVSDAAMSRLEALSCLRLSRDGGQDSPYERVRRDVAAVLACARVLKGAMGGGGSGGGATLEAYLDSLPEEELEALAEQRWARLRPDTVTEGDRDAVTQHSCSTRDGFFVVPKFG